MNDFTYFICQQFKKLQNVMIMVIILNIIIFIDCDFIYQRIVWPVGGII
jgi:hypothetical protein